MTPVKRYFQGAGFLLEGTRVILNIPGLFKYALIPFLIDLVLIVIGLSLGWGEVGIYATAAVTWIVGSSSGFLFSLLYYPLIAIFYLVFVGFLVYVVFLLSTVIASPFNSLLAERILIHYRIIPERPFNMGRWIRVSIKMIGVSIVRAIAFTVIGLLILVLSFVPVVNLAASFAAFCIIAFDCMDYSLEIMEMGFRERLRYFRNHFAEFSGMASVLGLTLLVPGLTLLMLPSSVAGSAVLAAKIKSGRPC